MFRDDPLVQIAIHMSDISVMHGSRSLPCARCGNANLGISSISSEQGNEGSSVRISVQCNGCGVLQGDEPQFDLLEFSIVATEAGLSLYWEFPFEVPRASLERRNTLKRRPGRPSLRADAVRKDRLQRRMMRGFSTLFRSLEPFDPGPDQEGLTWEIRQRCLGE